MEPITSRGRRRSPVWLLLLLSGCTAPGVGAQSPAAAGDTLVRAIISPRGGTVALPGHATVRVPPGAFAAPQPVLLISVDSQDLREEFEETPRSAGERILVPRTLLVQTGHVRPAVPLEVEVVLPRDVAASLRDNEWPQGYLQYWMNEGQELLDPFEPEPTRYDPARRTVSLAIPPLAFTDQRFPGRGFGAVLQVATGSPPVSGDPR